MKSLVIFSGGRGSNTLLKSLFLIKKKLNISTIINMYDDGKSSGMVRSLFNMPGPSDARKIQSTFLKNKKKTSKYKEDLFNLRISTTYLIFKKEINNFLNSNQSKIFGIIISNSLFKRKIKLYLKKFIMLLGNKFINSHDISFMNIIYVGAYFHHERNINLAIQKISDLFEIKNEIVSCGQKNLYLSGINSQNKIFYTEEEIVEQRSNTNMKKIFLTNKRLDKVNFKNFKNNIKIKKIKNLSSRDTISKEAKKLINSADVIIYAPGTPYSSLYPSYYVKGLGKEICNNKNAKKIMITNIGSDYETPKFSSNDYIKNTIDYLNFDYKYDAHSYITHCLINNPTSHKNYYVKPLVYKKFRNSFEIYEDNFEETHKQGVHSPVKLAKILNKII